MDEKKKSRWVKWLVIVLAVGGAIASVGWYFHNRAEAPPEYQSAKVTRGDLTQMVTGTGTLNPVTNVTVGSQISGIIQKLYADWNSPVKANQVVAQLDSATYRAAVAQAKADLTNAKANEELAAVSARRTDQLFKDKLVSDADHDTAVAALHQAQAQ